MGCRGVVFGFAWRGGKERETGGREISEAVRLGLLR